MYERLQLAYGYFKKDEQVNSSFILDLLTYPGVFFRIRIECPAGKSTARFSNWLREQIYKILDILLILLEKPNWHIVSKSYSFTDLEEKFLKTFEWWLSKRRHFIKKNY